jgi:hypothetical protein
MQIELDFAFDSKPRFGHGWPPHPGINALLNAGRERYARRLTEFAVSRRTFSATLSHTSIPQKVKAAAR